MNIHIRFAPWAAFLLCLFTMSTPPGLAQKAPRLEKQWETPPELTTAESVLYDNARKVLYVSCIGQMPVTKKDGDGFIAKVSLEGKIVQRQWITGLHAPKGMGLEGNKLYVTDIDEVVIIDVLTGQVTARTPVPGATMLNDLDARKDGRVYFTDSEQNKAYTWVKGQVKELFTNDVELKRMNGVHLLDEQALFAGSQSGNVALYSPADGSIRVVAKDIARGDGIERYKRGYFVSSWLGEVYFLDKNWQKTKLLDTKEAKVNAADIEVIAKKKLLLVPTFGANSVVAYRIR